MVKLILEINSVMDEDLQIRWCIDAASRLKSDAYVRMVDPDITLKKLESMGIRTAIDGVYGNPDSRPHIVIGNPDSLRNRLWNPVSSNALSKGLRHLVFDEIHLLESVTGANASMVMRRILANSGKVDKIMLTGATATIAEPEEHTARVFNRDGSKVVLSEPDPDEDPHELTGIVNHVIHKPTEGQNFEGTLANMSSLITHSRRRRKVGDGSIRERHKSIGFADSLQLLGAWNYLLRDLEGLELNNNTQKRLEEKKAKIRGIMKEPNSLPYKYNRPLVESVRKGLITGVSTEEAASHCDSCVSGVSSSIIVESDEGFAKIRTDVPSARKKEAMTGWEASGESREIGITDRCPFFEMGFCWREEEVAEYEPLYDGGPNFLSNAVRPLILSSKTISSMSDAGDPNEFYRTLATGSSDSLTTSDTTISGRRPVTWLDE